MASSLRSVKIAPKGMGLNDFVAQQEGFFAAEGLDVEFDWKTFRGTQSSWKGPGLFPAAAGPAVHAEQGRDHPGRLRLGQHLQCERRHGPLRSRRLRRFAVGDLRAADSKIRRPEDLKDVPISVGLRAGSHFNVPYRLEKYLPLEQIKTVNTGGFGARLKALLDGEVEAASLLPPQIAMARAARPAQDHRGSASRRCGGCPKTPRRRSCAAICARSTAPKRRSTPICAKYLPLWEIAVPGGVRALSPMGFQQVRTRRTFRLQAAAARGIRRDARRR